MKSAVLLIVGLTSPLVGSAVAQCEPNCLEREYRSNTGFPSSACWNLTVTSGNVTMSGGLLRLGAAAGGGVHYTSPRPGFSWQDGYVLEARLRVVEGSFSSPGIRSAAYIDIFDSAGRIGHMGIWSGGVAVSTHANVDPGPFTVVVPINASVLRTYRIESSNAGITLSIDGAVVAAVPYSNFTLSFPSSLGFGSDTRFMGQAITEWEYVRFSALTNTPSQSICPGESAIFAVDAAGTGPFTYAWQRRVPPGIWTTLSNGSIPGVGLVSGTSSPQLVINSPVPGASASLRCQVSNACGIVTSSPVTLNVSRCDCIDFNNDGVEYDAADIEAYLSVYSGGPCIPTTALCSDLDFNNDGVENDPSDIESFLSIYSGGPCF